MAQSPSELMYQARSDVEKIVADASALGNIPPVIQGFLVARMLMLVTDTILRTADATMTHPAWFAYH